MLSAWGTIGSGGQGTGDFSDPTVHLYALLRTTSRSSEKPRRVRRYINLLFVSKLIPAHGVSLPLFEVPTTADTQ
jgi:hypothetical protein